MKRIGITTTVPVEVLLAAGCQPVDLNNLFIGHSDPESLISQAERAGFPQNCCSWIKGIYGACLENGINEVLGVTTGDCSNTLMLMEVFRLNGIKVLNFAYPESQDPALMRKALDHLAYSLNTNMERSEDIRLNLSPVRELTGQLDRMTWESGLVSGLENHLWLVSTSDFNGSHRTFFSQLKDFISLALTRKPYPDGMLRLAYIGVPPVYARELYPFIESQGGRVVFNEVQRQFSMPGPSCHLEEQYSRYTYPYSIYDRLKDIKEQLDLRRVDGIIHYVQAFCHRGIGDIIFRSAKGGFSLPLLTLEGNTDFGLTHHLKTRIEAFMDMLYRSRRLLTAAEQASSLSA